MDLKSNIEKDEFTATPPLNTYIFYEHLHLHLDKNFTLGIENKKTDPIT